MLSAKSSAEGPGQKGRRCSPAATTMPPTTPPTMTPMLLVLPGGGSTGGGEGGAGLPLVVPKLGEGPPGGSGTGEEGTGSGEAGNGGLGACLVWQQFGRVAGKYFKHWVGGCRVGSKARTESACKGRPTLAAGRGNGGSCRAHRVTRLHDQEAGARCAGGVAFFRIRVSVGFPRAVDDLCWIVWIQAHLYNSQHPISAHRLGACEQQRGGDGA